MYSLGEIAKIVRGSLTGDADTRPLRVVHDSRTVEPGDLFVALRGARTDGHAFLGEVFRRGACGSLVADAGGIPEDTPGLIVVADPLEALQRLASAWRDRLPSKQIGITGSFGKTTTRTLTAHLLRTAFTVHEPPGNFNTEIGLPLALLAMPEAAEVGVFELGAERPGDIGFLAELLRPYIAVLTGVGPSHLDGFGSIEAIAEEKWSLVAGLDRSAIAFVNADSPHLLTRIPKAPCAVRSVGVEAGNLRGRVERDVPELVLEVDEPRMHLRVPLLGAQNASNVLLAVACALHLGVKPQTIEEAIGDYVPPHQRLRALEAPFGTVLDDTYNANPASVKAALRVLAAYGAPDAHRVFVFGDMLGLGEASDRMHREIVGFAESLGIDRILPVGERAAAACGVAAPKAEDRPRTVRSVFREGENVVLVKGSRALALEHLVAALLRKDGTGSRRRRG